MYFQTEMALNIRNISDLIAEEFRNVEPGPVSDAERAVAEEMLSLLRSYVVGDVECDEVLELDFDGNNCFDEEEAEGEEVEEEESVLFDSDFDPNEDIAEEKNDPYPGLAKKREIVNYWILKGTKATLNRYRKIKTERTLRRWKAMLEQKGKDKIRTLAHYFFKKKR